MSQSGQNFFVKGFTCNRGICTPKRSCTPPKRVERGLGTKAAGKRARRGRGGEALRAWALRAGRTSPPRAAARYRVPVLHVHRMLVAAGEDVPGVGLCCEAGRGPRGCCFANCGHANGMPSSVHAICAMCRICKKMLWLVQAILCSQRHYGMCML